MRLKLFPALRAEKDRGRLQCPFCRDSIYPAVTITRCTSCRTVHHEKCWQDNSRCSVFGCRGTAQQEHTEFYLVEAFQKRRKRLIRSWYVSIISAVLITLCMSYSLQNIMPIQGAALFSGAVALVILAIIILDGYAQYLCPACGYQPRIITRRKKFLFQFSLPYEVIHSRLLLKPINCPTCKVRLR